MDSGNDSVKDDSDPVDAGSPGRARSWFKILGSSHDTIPIDYKNASNHETGCQLNVINPTSKDGANKRV